MVTKRLQTNLYHLVTSNRKGSFFDSRKRCLLTYITFATENSSYNYWLTGFARNRLFRNIYDDSPKGLNLITKRNF